MSDNIPYQNINPDNISQINPHNPDTLTIAVIGDSQRYYEHTRKVVERINLNDKIDFVIHTGDIVDFGTEQEYVWSHELLSDLNIPYIAVIGNHDLIGNGGEIYRYLYGEYDFHFTVSRIRFIYLNTNSRELDFNHSVPDLNFLDRALSDTSSYDNAIIVSHVSYWHDDFDPALRGLYSDIVTSNPKIILCLNGHGHNFLVTEPASGLPMLITTSSTSKEKFVYLKIWNNGFEYELRE